MSLVLLKIGVVIRESPRLVESGSWGEPNIVVTRP